MPSSPPAGRRLGASLLLAGVALAAFFIPDAGTWLQFDRAAVALGEWWRLVTGHFAHWSAEHLFWDVTMFVLLAGWCEMRSRARMVVCLLASMVVISAGVGVALPSLATYRGLSGVDSALFVLLATDLLRGASRRRDFRAISMLLACLAAFGAKVVYEVLTGDTIVVDASAADMIPVPLAHLLGGAVGALVALTWMSGEVVGPQRRDMVVERRSAG